MHFKNGTNGGAGRRGAASEFYEVSELGVGDVPGIERVCVYDVLVPGGQASRQGQERGRQVARKVLRRLGRSGEPGTACRFWLTPPGEDEPVLAYAVWLDFAPVVHVATREEFRSTWPWLELIFGDAFGELDLLAGGGAAQVALPKAKKDDDGDDDGGGADHRA